MYANHIDNYFKIKYSNIGGNYAKAYVFTKYGIHISRKDHISKGIIPTIISAVDKTSYFKNMLYEIIPKHISIKDVEYNNAKTKIKMHCKYHGFFSITPNSIISKNAFCPKCSNKKSTKKNRKNTAYFIKKSKIKHGDFYNYNNVKYIDQFTSVCITCPIHGKFLQTPKNHMRGSGCSKCGRIKISKARSKDPTGWTLKNWIKTSKTSAEFDSFKLYLIKINDEKESFIKIGRTFKTTKRRFHAGIFPYNFNTLIEIKDDPEKIYKLELNLRSKFKKHRYVPNKKFNGMYECFNSNVEQLIVKELNNIIENNI